jgi:hypothetical protein
MNVVKSTLLRLFGALCLLHSVGCKSAHLEPEFAPSTDQPSYAKQHPAQLKSASQDFEEQLALAETLSQELKEYPGELKDPDWKGTLEVVDRADLEGRSPHYATSLEQNGDVAAFYEAEKPEIHKGVGGAVQYHAKNKGCEADMYSPAAHALDKTMDKRLEQRTRDHSEAHSYIALNEPSLGKANIPALQRQADRIALASYVTHVGLVRKKNQLDTLLSDADAVDRTLEQRIKELEAQPLDEKAPAEQVKARQDELEALQTARSTLAEQLAPARQQAEAAEQRIMQARQSYDDALSKLKESIEQQAAQATSEK